MGIHDLLLFVAAGVLLNFAPGPDMALIIARSTRQGARAGLVAALGISAGLCVHIAEAAIGISAIIVASAAAFTFLKWAGALYLIFIGLRIFKSSFEARNPATDQEPAKAAAPRAIFMQGFLTNVLNPKIAIFFLAFLPQFVDAGSRFKFVPLLTLGLLFNAVGTAWNIGVALFAARLGRSVAYKKLRSWLERAIGVLFVGVGIKLALADRP